MALKMILNEENTERILSSIEALTSMNGYNVAVTKYKSMCDWTLCYTKDKIFNGWALKLETPWEKEFEDYLLKERKIDKNIKIDERYCTPYQRFALIIDKESSELILCKQLWLQNDQNLWNQKYLREKYKGYFPSFKGYYHTIPLRLFKSENQFVKFCAEKFNQINKVYLDLCNEIETKIFDEYKEFKMNIKRKEINKRKADLKKDFYEY